MHAFRLTALVLLSFACSFGASANDAIREAISKLQPNANDIHIEPSAVEGVSEVSIGLQVLYVSDDGQFALGGPLISLSNGTNLTEQRLSSARAATLKQATEVNTFHYPAPQAKHKVTVFTDIDCPHCRRLHNELPAMQAAGIDVTYVLLPRSGAGSASYQKSINAACAQNPEEAITSAMAGKLPAPASCEHPIDDHLKLSRAMNVSSTPSIVLEDGQMVLGYRTASALLKALEQRKQAGGSTTLN